jgi:urease accessory protein
MRPQRWVVVSVLGGVGLFRYAYGESIVGAEPTPLVAYLLGLSLVQAALGAVSWRIARPVREDAIEPSRLAFVRVLGIASVAIGIAALS